MDPPPFKRPEMDLPLPQFGLEKLGDWFSTQRLEAPPPPRIQPQNKPQIAEASSTTGNSTPDTSPKGLSLPVDPSEEKGLTLTITKAAHNCLQTVDGTYFRELITQHLSVVVLFINPNAGHFVSCKLDGAPENLEKAKVAVQNFCETAALSTRDIRQRTGFATSFTDMQFLDKNLKILSDANICWFYMAQNQYDHIVDLVDGINPDSTRPPQYVHF